MRHAGTAGPVPGLTWVTAAIVVVLISLAAFVSASQPARAQSCSADSQCRDGGISRTYCSGNSVVSARSVCIGTCRTVEESRVPCAGQCLGGRCVGGLTPRLDSQGRIPRCVPGCACRNRILIITSGVWTPDGGCEQRIQRCARGCTCEPTPRCR